MANSTGLSTGSTDIKFSSVREAAAMIKQNKEKMQTNFENFGTTVRGLKDRGQFVGSAADSFDEKYERLSQTFSKYTDKVQEFFDIIGYSADSTEQEQSDLQKIADSLDDR